MYLLDVPVNRNTLKDQRLVPGRTQCLHEHLSSLTGVSEGHAGVGVWGER